MTYRNQQELFQYYDERAPEYEEFYRGSFVSPIDKPDLYRDDTREISRLLPEHISGHCLDIACGTAFWLPYYHHNCSHITLVDQSENVLYECRKKIDRLNIRNKTRIIQADIFEYEFPEHHYDSINVGFLISHFTDEELNRFFDNLKNTLVPGGRFTIVASTWNEDIQARGHQKQGIITRELFDGRTFEIYKRFFDSSDLTVIAGANNLSMDIEYWGKVFFLAAGTFK